MSWSLRVTVQDIGFGVHGRELGSRLRFTVYVWSARLWFVGTGFWREDLSLPFCPEARKCLGRPWTLNLYKCPWLNFTFNQIHPYTPRSNLTQIQSAFRPYNSTSAPSHIVLVIDCRDCCQVFLANFIASWTQILGHCMIGNLHFWGLHSPAATSYVESSATPFIVCWTHSLTCVLDHHSSIPST